MYSVKKIFLTISQSSQGNTSAGVFFKCSVFDDFFFFRLGVIFQGIPTYVFSCDIWEIFKNMCFVEHLTLCFKGLNTPLAVLYYDVYCILLWHFEICTTMLSCDVKMLFLLEFVWCFVLSHFEIIISFCKKTRHILRRYYRLKRLNRLRNFSVRQYKHG